MFPTNPEISQPLICCRPQQFDPSEGHHPHQPRGQGGGGGGGPLPGGGGVGGVLGLLTQGEVWPDIRGAGADRSDGRRRPTAAIWRICAYRYSEGLVLTYEGLVLIC